MFSTVVILAQMRSVKLEKLHRASVAIVKPSTKQWSGRLGRLSRFSLPLQCLHLQPHMNKSKIACSNEQTMNKNKYYPVLLSNY